MSTAEGQRILHLTLGPVQGFVAQARRTRDLWAGSFLLSWLAGQAMHAVTQAGGTIVLPEVEGDPLLAAIRTPPGRSGPAVGSLPNRFKARVPAEFDPHACWQAIDDTWRTLADRVWQRFVKPVVPLGHDTQAIWDRQVAGFWDVSWVTGADPGDRSDLGWLDRRKNWRTWRPPVEGGDHCTLMGDWQELSGYVRARERSKQDAFWAALRERLENPLDLDEQGRERLCAMALIKRLFLEVANDAIGWKPSWDGQAVRWPSTARLAAAGWLGSAWGAARAEAGAFVDAVRPTGRADVEPPLAAGDALSRVAGQFLHRSGIENARAEELHGADRGRLLKAHDALSTAAGRSPSPCYALLLMDGDSVGRLLHAQETEVARALARFASCVGETVRRHGGYTVYAGGDDLLALLPIEGALNAAIALRNAYVGAFNAEAFADAAQRPTTSAALVFAHFRVPLRQVLREAHRRLDKVAKDGNGRDSLAVCVLSQGGVLRQWVSAWRARDGHVEPPMLMNDLATRLAGTVAGRFFYKVRETWGAVLSPENGNDPAPPPFSTEQMNRILGSDRPPTAGADRSPVLAERMNRILVAEFLAGETPDAERLAEVTALVGEILALARRSPGDGEPRPEHFDMDGPLLARFLGQERQG